MYEDECEKNRFAPEITQGMVLMFEHRILHEGAKLLKGVKYIIRTDVMYTYDEVEEDETDQENEDSDNLAVDDEPTAELKKENRTA